MTRKNPPSSGNPTPEAKRLASAERLQKVLAAAGLGSRRQCEELILEGRVEIDGQVADQLGVKVDPYQQEIRVDGTKLPRPTRKYYLVNKPVGVVCTNRDPAGRLRIIDLVSTEERLFSVGRLDRTSEGLILLTNDGEFANRLAHPRYGVHKTYRVLVAGRPEPEQLKLLIRGVHLAEGVARAVSVRVKKKYRDSTDLEIVLNEGKNREIRRVLARIGHKVLRLKRIAIGSVKLADLPEGQSRRLQPREVRALLAETERPTSRGSAPPARPPSARPGPGKRPAAPPSRSKSPPVATPRSGSVLTFEEDQPELPVKPRAGAKKGARRAAARPGGGRTGKGGRKKATGKGRGGHHPASGQATTRGEKRFTTAKKTSGAGRPKRNTTSGGKPNRQGGQQTRRKGRE